MLTSRLLRLAGPMARRPAAFIALGLIVCALGSIGLVRWSVDPGTDLLVGRSSDIGQANQRFASTYGGDPIVVLFSTSRPDAYYDDTNLRRLTRLESDLAANPHVQSVVGPGTLMHSALESVQSQITQALTGYDSFFQNLELLDDIQKAGGDASKVTTQQQQKAQTDAQQADLAFLATIAAAAQKADEARTAYLQALQTDPKPNDRFLDSEEQAATAAAATVPLPPLFSEYVGGGTANDAAARATLSTFSASYGNCLSVVAQVNKVTASCQAFEWRFLLDLPHCPLNAAKQFCSPKPEWSAVLPQPQNGQNLAIITVRLKAADTNDPNAVDNVVTQLQNELQNGLPNDSSQATVALGPFNPTACPGRQATTANPNTGCASDSRISYTVAGIPQLTSALSRETRDLLVELLPIVVLAMLLILAGAFRVRGRMWPLLAAGGATLLTVGLALLIGTPLTPAVIAGVPVLVGLGVDYAVQLVARFSEEREGGLGVEAALRVTLSRTGPATLVAAAATVAGLAFLLLFAGVDLGPLVAIPLVAEFAGVLIAGVVLAWLAAVLIALPAATWVELRRSPVAPLRARGRRAAGDDAREHPEAAELPVLRRLSQRWSAVLAVAAIPALLGWALLPRVPVETDATRLLSRGLPELQQVQDVQAQTGASNELDLFVEGNVAADPKALDYQLDLEWLARCRTGNQVVTTFSMASLLDELLNPAARASGAPSGSPYPCSGPMPSQVHAAATPSPSPSTSPQASPSASTSPAATPSPVPAAASPSPSAQAQRVDGQPVFRAAAVHRRAPAADTPGSSPSPTAAPAGPAAPATASPGATPSPSGSSVTPQQLANLQLPPASVCALRLFARLASAIVGPNGANGIQPPPAASGQPGTQACPPPNALLSNQNVGLYQDPTPVTVDNTRMPMTIAPASVADQAALIDSLNTQRAALTQPASVTGVHAAGLVALAAQAYDTLTGRALLLNLLPLLVVALALLTIHREPRRALLPVLPTAVAAGWGPLLILLLGRLPGEAGRVLGSLTPLTVVLGALVVALGTEFGVVILHRFYEERARGLDPDEAAEATIGATGKAVLISAGTLAAGFGVLALSGALPRGATSKLGFDWHSLPIVSAFGLTVVLDLALAVLAVFAVMLPLAVALEKRAPVAAADTGAAQFRAVDRAPSRRPAPAPAPVGDEFVVDEEEPEAGPSEPVEEEEPVAVEARPRLPGTSTRRRPAAASVAKAPTSEVEPVPPTTAETRPPARLPGMTGRRRAPAPSAKPFAVSVEMPVEPAPRVLTRLPGGLRRRRVPPPAEVAPEPVIEPPPAEAPRHRMPGSVATRRRVPSPEAVVTPAAEAAEVAGAAEVAAAAEAAAPTVPRAPVAGVSGPTAPPPAPPKKRRRRPPPHIRRQQPPEE